MICKHQRRKRLASKEIELAQSLEIGSLMLRRFVVDVAFTETAFPRPEIAIAALQIGGPYVVVFSQFLLGVRNGPAVSVARPEGAVAATGKVWRFEGVSTSAVIAPVTAEWLKMTSRTTRICIVPNVPHGPVPRGLPVPKRGSISRKFWIP